MEKARRMAVYGESKFNTAVAVFSARPAEVRLVDECQ
jgi:hypothetical protein